MLPKVERPEVFAVSLSEHGPLGEVHFRFQPHVNAIYGKNGAGKSWLIRSLHRALSGLRDDHVAWVHYCFDEEVVQSDDPYADGIQSQLLVALGRVQNYWMDGPLIEAEDTRELSPQAPLSLSVRRVLDEGGVLGRDTPILSEVANSRTFALRPWGHGESVWRVYASLAPSAETPAFNTLLDYWRFRRIQDRNFEEVRLRVVELTKQDRGEEALELVLNDALRLKNHPEGADLNARLDDFQITQSVWEYVKESLDTLPGLLDENLPIPLVPLCDLELTDGFSILVGELDQELEQRTLKDLEASVPAIINAMSDSEVCLTTLAEQDINFLSHWANEYIASILGPSAPMLRCAIPGWRSRHPLMWQASLDDGETWFRFEELGSGQRRWATVSAQLAVANYELESNELGAERNSGWMPFWKSIVLIDEPEMGLHPMAQRQMFEGLSQLGGTVVAATHSASPFAQYDITLWWLHNSAEGPSILTSIDEGIGALLAGSSDYGVERTDVLGAVGTFLLVEGEHDKAVISSVVGEELSRLRVACYPVNGTKAQGAASIGMLLQFTQAHIVFAVDNDQGQLATQCWSEALDQLRAGDKPAARRALVPLKNRGTEEQLFLWGVCDQAMKSGAFERLRVTGWPQPDVICLLPVKAFLPDFDTWGHVESARRSGENIKGTVKRLRGKPIGIREIREVASTLDYVPQEIVQLLQLLGNLS